jgi:hypothetical protein
VYADPDNRGECLPGVDWVARIPKERLMESATFREITAEAERKGREEGERRVLALQLQERLGPDAERLTHRLALCTPDALDDVAKLLVSTKLEPDLLQTLEQLLPGAE